MRRELLLLRHAKSAWDAGVSTDFERPLSKRGKRDAPLVGQWLAEQGLVPDHVVSSPAERARATALKVCRACGLAKKDVVWDARIYEAELGDLLAVLADCPGAARRILLVGHNPGLDYLLSYLWGNEMRMPEDGKLLPTAAVARLAMPQDWAGLATGAGTLLSLTRPGQMQGA